MILIPYFIFLGIYQVGKRSFEIDQILLYANLFHSDLTYLFPFWFVQVLLQCLLFLGIVFSIPALRRYASGSPMAFSFLMLSCLIAIREIYPLFWETGQGKLNDLVPLRFMAILWLGWCFYFVENFQQKLLLCAIGIGFAFLDTALIWGFDFATPQTTLPGKTKWLVIGSIFLAFVPRVPVPTFSKNIFNDIGAATFYIFVFNGVIIKLTARILNIETGVGVFFISMIGSMLIWWTIERMRLVARLQALMNFTYQGRS